MLIRAITARAAEFRCRSGANAVLLPQNAPEFRRRRAWLNWVQLIDCKKILDPAGPIFSGETAIFRCQQRYCDGLVIGGAGG